MSRAVNGKCPGPVSRRSILKAGALGLGGFALGDLLRLRSQAAESKGVLPDDTSVIFVWLPGGPPHMETYDMKPDAPSEYRGEFRPISTKVPGIDVCELLPQHAQVADKFTLIRSISHGFADHGGGHKKFLAIRDPLEPAGFVNDYPCAPSIVAKMRESRDIGLPNYVSGTDGGRDGVDVFSFGAAYLGSTCTPFSVVGDPSEPKFSVRNVSLPKEMSSRLEDRRTLLGSLDRLKREVDRRGTMESMDEFNRQAFSLLTSERARNAFDITHEPEALRERYGKHCWGHRCLLARRLVEAGCSFVTMVLENPYQSGVPHLRAGVYNWDSHSVNCHIFEDARVRFPIYDQAISALVEDIYQRGLDRKVLLVVTGEFGRTPRIGPAIGTQTGVMQPGRDHWPSAMSVLVAGGGMRTGQVVGSTNRRGEVPQERPLTPADLWATVFRHLGIDTETAFPDLSGRPMPILPYGAPIEELLPSARA